MINQESISKCSSLFIGISKKVRVIEHFLFIFSHHSTYWKNISLYYFRTWWKRKRRILQVSMAFYETCSNAEFWSSSETQSVLQKLTDHELTHWTFLVLMNYSCPFQISSFTLLWRKYNQSCLCLLVHVSSRACFHNMIFVSISQKT